MRHLLMLALVTTGASGCDWTKPNTPAADERTRKEALANARKLKRACGSAETYDRLKAYAFDEAAKIGRTRSPMLDTLAANVTVRMENPVAKSRDEELDVTVCEGHLVLDLPPGTEDAFDGDRRLEADVEYAAQAAVDGSGLVYQMQGAEPIIYRLAALTLNGSRAAPVVVAAAPPEAPPTVAAAPPVLARPRPAPPAPEPVRERAGAQLPSPPRPPIAPSEIVMPTLPTAPVARPSFNCRVARGRVERMICGDAALAAQDRRMSSRFYAALATGDPEVRAALRGSRDRWLAFRNRCPTTACVSQAYADRTAEIADIAAGQGG